MLDNHKYDNIYIDYHRIEQNLFRERIRYYENHLNELTNLNFIQKLEVDIDYCSCLFEIGKYYNYLEKVDPLIESVIIDNIYQLNGKDVYSDLLFKKAASLYNIDKLEESSQLSSQLIRISPNEQSKTIHSKCLRRLYNNKLKWLGAISILFLLSGLSLSLIILLVFDPFYPEVANYFMIARNLLFGSGVLLILCKEFWMIFNISRNIGYNFSQSAIVKTYNKMYKSIYLFIETLINKTKNRL